MLDDEINDNEEYYSPLDALNEDDYDESNYDGDEDESNYDGDEDESNYDGDEDSYFEGDEAIVECTNCNHSWDLANSSPEDAYVCHKCGTDLEQENSEMSSFDDSVFNMDFSEIRGKNFKQSFGKVNRRIDSQPRKRRRPIRRPRRSAIGMMNRTEKGKYQGRQSQPRIGRPKRRGMLKPMGLPTSRPTRSPLIRPTGSPASRPSATPSFKANVKPLGSSGLKPLVNKFPTKGGKLSAKAGTIKKGEKISLANNKKVIIKGASNFILSQKTQDEGIKGIQYYKGKKLKPLILTINNEDPTDFVLELFNPSMPLDYLYSTSQNLNNRVKVAGGNTSYSHVLFNILANPVMVVNVQMVSSGIQVANQNNQSIFVTNKNIEGYQKIFPVNIDLQVDNMQVANDIVYFNVFRAINRPFIPDGMDIIRYTVLAGMSVTMTFWYTQVSLKKFFFEEAKASKSIL